MASLMRLRVLAAGELAADPGTRLAPAPRAAVARKWRRERFMFSTRAGSTRRRRGNVGIQGKAHGKACTEKGPAFQQKPKRTPGNANLLAIAYNLLLQVKQKVVRTSLADEHAAARRVPHKKKKSRIPPAPWAMRALPPSPGRR